MGGKPLTQASGEELTLVAVPHVLGVIIGALTFALNNTPNIAVAAGVVTWITTFAIFWPRLVDLGFEIEDPRF